MKNLAKADYMRACSSAKAELQRLLNDVDTKRLRKSNLRYLIRRALWEIEGIEKYVSNFGIEEGGPIEDDF